MSTNHSRVSVVMCTFNGERHVGEQVRSILSQTTSVSELVVADDGSTDRTLESVRRAFDVQRNNAVDLRILEPAPARFGFVRNFERAMLAAKGDVVVLSDQDDRWLPRRLESGLDLLRSNPDVSVVVSNAVLIDSEGARHEQTLFDRMGHPDVSIQSGVVRPTVRGLVRRNSFPGMTMMIRADFLRSVLPIPTGWVHDYWIALFAAAEDKLAVYPNPLVEYRLHSANTVGVEFSRRIGLYRRAWDVLRGAARAGAVASADWSVSDLTRINANSCVDGKVAHEKLRGGLSAHRLQRLGKIAVSIQDYRQFARHGLLTALRDVWVPPHSATRARNAP